MTENVKLVFEVADVRNASPATVSRVGVVFVADTDLDWMVLVDSFVVGFQSHFAQLIRRLFMEVVAGEDASYMGASGAKDTGSWYGLRRGGCA
jgi:dynein heavy chain